jgi:hypothetical protein
MSYSRSQNDMLFSERQNDMSFRGVADDKNKASKRQVVQRGRKKRREKGLVYFSLLHVCFHDMNFFFVCVCVSHSYLIHCLT